MSKFTEKVISNSGLLMQIENIEKIKEILNKIVDQTIKDSGKFSFSTTVRGFKIGDQDYLRILYILRNEKNVTRSIEDKFSVKGYTIEFQDGRQIFFPDVSIPAFYCLKYYCHFDDHRTA